MRRRSSNLFLEISKRIAFISQPGKQLSWHTLPMFRCHNENKHNHLQIDSEPALFTLKTDTISESYCQPKNIYKVRKELPKYPTLDSSSKTVVLCTHTTASGAVTVKVAAAYWRFIVTPCRGRD